MFLTKDLLRLYVIQLTINSGWTLPELSRRKPQIEFLVGDDCDAYISEHVKIPEPPAQPTASAAVYNIINSTIIMNSGLNSTSISVPAPSATSPKPSATAVEDDEASAISQAPSTGNSSSDVEKRGVEGVVSAVFTGAILAVTLFEHFKAMDKAKLTEILIQVSDIAGHKTHKIMQRLDKAKKKLDKCEKKKKKGKCGKKEKKVKGIEAEYFRQINTDECPRRAFAEAWRRRAGWNSTLDIMCDIRRHNQHVKCPKLPLKAFDDMPEWPGMKKEHCSDKTKQCKYNLSA